VRQREGVRGLVVGGNIQFQVSSSIESLAEPVKAMER